jgi:addiction module HigA family antidote
VVQFFARISWCPPAPASTKLALDLHVAPNRILEIVKGKRAITADTALRLAQYLGTTPDFWLGLQMQYDLERAQGRTFGKDSARGAPERRVTTPQEIGNIKASRIQNHSRRGK